MHNIHWNSYSHNDVKASIFPAAKIIHKLGFDVITSSQFGIDIKGLDHTKLITTKYFK